MLFPVDFPLLNRQSKRPLRIMGADSRHKVSELACSDLAMEEALYEMTIVRQFARLSLERRCVDRSESCCRVMSASSWWRISASTSNAQSKLWAR